jgi:hypothetical protein
MCEQTLACVVIRCGERVPQIGRLMRERPALPRVLGRPRLMAALNRLGRFALGQPRRLRGERHLPQRVQRSQQGHIRTLAQRVAQRQGAVRCQFGHQPVGQRLDAIFLLGLCRHVRSGLD